MKTVARNRRSSPETATERFIAIASDATVTDEGCWIWPFIADKEGYGKFRFGSGTYSCHRFSYEYFVGLIPEDLEIDHVCHSLNPDCPGGVCLHRLCFNPGHLEVVTGEVNRRRTKSRKAAQTQCVHGHEFTPENTYWIGDTRVCRTCRCNAVRRYRGKNPSDSIRFRSSPLTDEQFLQLLSGYGVFTCQQVTTMTGRSRSSVQDRLAGLERAGFLVTVATRPKTWRIDRKP